MTTTNGYYARLQAISAATRKANTARRFGQHAEARRALAEAQRARTRLGAARPPAKAGGAVADYVPAPAEASATQHARHEAPATYHTLPVALPGRKTERTA